MAVAPALASQLPGGAAYHVPGDAKEVVYTGTVGAGDTYVTNGFAITAAQLGLSTLLEVSNVVFSTGHWGMYVPATGLIKVFSAAGTELVNASAALQSATFTLKATGR